MVSRKTDFSFLEDLRRRCRVYRAEQRLSQEAMADVLGLSHSQYQRFESAGIPKRAEDLDAIIRLVASDWVRLANQLRALAIEVESPTNTDRAKSSAVQMFLENYVTGAQGVNGNNTRK